MHSMHTIQHHNNRQMLYNSRLLNDYFNAAKTENFIPAQEILDDPWFAKGRSNCLL